MARKSKYDPYLSAKERHRVADALYRMKVEGFNFPSTFDPRAITNASSYASIRHQAAGQPGVTFSAIIWGKGGYAWSHPGDVPGDVAEERIQAEKEYHKAVNKAVMKSKGKLKRSDFPEYNVENVAPSSIGFDYTSIASEEGQRAVNAEYEKNMIESTHKLRSLAKNPRKIIKKRMITAYDNLLTSLNKTFNNEFVRDLIEDKVKAMGPTGLDNWRKENGNALFSDFYGYNFMLGMSIGRVLKSLGIDLNTEMPDGHTLEDYVMTAEATGVM